LPGLIADHSNSDTDGVGHQIAVGYPAGLLPAVG